MMSIDVQLVMLEIPSLYFRDLFLYVLPPSYFNISVSCSSSQQLLAVFHGTFPLLYLSLALIRAKAVPGHYYLSRAFHQCASSISTSNKKSSDERVMAKQKQHPLRFFASYLSHPFVAKEKGAAHGGLHCQCTRSTPKSEPESRKQHISVGLDNFE